MSEHLSQYNSTNEVERLNPVEEFKDAPNGLWVERSDGRIESGWMPYDTEFVEDGETGELFVKLYKPREEGDGYKVKSVEYAKLFTLQQEQEELENTYPDEQATLYKKPQIARMVHRNPTYRQWMEKLGDQLDEDNN